MLSHNILRTKTPMVYQSLSAVNHRRRIENQIWIGGLGYLLDHFGKAVSSRIAVTNEQNIQSVFLVGFGF